MLERYIAEHISTRPPRLRHAHLLRTAARGLAAAPCALSPGSPTHARLAACPPQRSEELPISHLDLDTLGAFGDFEAFKVRRGPRLGASRLC